MMKSIRSICLLTLAISCSAIAKNGSEWVFAAGSESGAEFYFSPKHLHSGSYKGETTLKIDGKYVHPDKSVQLVVFEISNQQCEKGTGTIWMLDRAGKSLSGNDFNLRVNSTASELARKLCALR